LQVSESADEQQEQEPEPEQEQEQAGEVTPEQAQETLDAMLDAIREAKVAQLILSTVSTLASVAYGKLEAKDTVEAKKAIDAIDALLPLLEGEVDESISRDFGQALTNLKLSYADAVASAQ
jgi:hypothetical protein